MGLCTNLSLRNAEEHWPCRL